MIVGLLKIKNKYIICKYCIFEKQHRNSFQTSQRAKKKKA